MKVMMLDTETTNELDCPICYDIGFSVVDLDEGEVIERHSYVVADVFCDKELMSSAYFIDKVPQYWTDIKNGTRMLRRWATIKHIVADVMAQYGIDTVVAHNARFDYISTATTQRYLTSSKWRHFFPYGTKFVCTLKMARQIFGKDDDYIAFCKEHEYLTTYKKPKFTAEVIYRYLTNDLDFEESHTGLEDVEIETVILLKCIKINPEVDGLLW